MTHSKFKGAVDRITWGKAVILLEGGGEMIVALNRLPGSASEGDIIAFTAVIDDRAASEKLAEAEDLKKKLKKRR